jgi:hypothetical protein
MASLTAMRKKVEQCRLEIDNYSSAKYDSGKDLHRFMENNGLATEIDRPSHLATYLSTENQGILSGPVLQHSDVSSPVVRDTSSSRYSTRRR